MSRFPRVNSGLMLCGKVGLMLSMICAAPVCCAQQFQSWNEVDLIASWKTIDFLIPAVARTDTSLPNPQFVAIGFVAFVPLSAHLKLVGGYLFADLPQSSQVAHVPVLAVEAVLHKHTFALMDQNRFEKLIDYRI